MTILSCKSIFGPSFSAILENFFAMSQKLQFLPKMTIFWPNLAPKQIFSGKMTILFYKTIFGPTLSAILENLLKLSLRNDPKTAILAKNGHFWHIRPNLVKWEFFSKMGLCYFYPYYPPTSCQVSEKIDGAVSEINSLHPNIRTYEHTNKGDPIEPVAFAGSIFWPKGMMDINFFKISRKKAF